MAPIPKYNPRQLRGVWDRGYALDIHTHSSVPLGGGFFDTERSEVGELLYKLKYKGDQSALGPIVAACVDCIQSRFSGYAIQALIGVPPSETNRRVQPVQLVVEELARALGVADLSNRLRKVKDTPPLKSISETEKRQVALKGAFVINKLGVETVLVVDDLFRSGETATELVNTIRANAGVKTVLLLTVTQTRTRT